MVTKEKLYEAFGELIYAVAKADGLVQAEELITLEKILRGHPWASTIHWSFDYENSKHTKVSEVYKRAMDTFLQHGPDAEYAYLVEILEEIAKAGSGTIDEKEQRIIDAFQLDFKNRFIQDMSEKNLI